MTWTMPLIYNFFILSAYYKHPEVKATTQAIIEAACDENVQVTSDQVSKWAEHTMKYLLLKSNKRYESWYRMTKAQFFLALKDGRKVFFPYKPASQQDIDAGGTNIVLSDDCAYR